MLKNDEAFKVFSKLFFEKGLKYQVHTDYELLKLPKRLDVVVIKGALSLAKKLKFFSYFRQYNIISFKSFTDRLKKADLYDALIYAPAYAKNERLKNLKGITVTVISAYQRRGIVKELGLKEVRGGVYEYEGGQHCLRLVVLNEVELEKGEWDLALVFMFAGRKKLWELKDWLKENKESFREGRQYFLTVLPLFRKEGLKILEEVGEMGKRGEFVIDIAENLRYLKSLGFKVKTYEEIFGEGRLVGRKEGLEEGLQKGLQEGLQKGLQKGLQEGLQEAILSILEFRFGNKGKGYKEELEAINEIERLRALKRAVLEVNDLNAFEEILRGGG
jgi:hypothetical protein